MGRPMSRKLLLALSIFLLLPRRSAGLQDLFTVAPVAPVQRLVARLLTPLPKDAETLKWVDALCRQLEDRKSDIKCSLPPDFEIGDCPVCSRGCSDLILEILPNDNHRGKGELLGRFDTERERWEGLLSPLVLSAFRSLGLNPPSLSYEVYEEPFLEPSADPLEARQKYKGRKPGVGGTTEVNNTNVKVVDIECDVDKSHEDLPALADDSIRSELSSDKSHGAAVLGILAAPRNGSGIWGIAPDASAGFVGVTCKGDSTRDLTERRRNLEYSLKEAALRVGRGGIIVLPIQMSGIQLTDRCPNPSCRKMPVELSPTTHLLIEGITRCGVTVVESAGNGACPLDDVMKFSGGSCEPVFDRSRCDSGAILVGAGRADDSARMPSSNYGARVDVHAWGERVTTLGYGDLGTLNAPSRQQYTDLFSGTSAATAIVAGAAARLAGHFEADKLPPPFELRSLIVDTGVRGPASPDIGPLPDVKEAVQQAKARAKAAAKAAAAGKAGEPSSSAIIPPCHRTSTPSPPPRPPAF
jgi:subtilisin family serine protease